MKTSKPLTFVPPKHGRGKWHAVSCGASCLPVCGKAVELDPQSSVREVIAGGAEIDTLHPTYCRECLRHDPDGYPTVRLVRTSYGYATRDGRYAVVRDTVSDIGSSNNGCYKACWHVHEGSPAGARVAKFLDSLREARTEVACLYEGSAK